MGSNNIHDKILNKNSKAKNSRLMNINKQIENYNTLLRLYASGIPSARGGNPAYIYRFNDNCIDFNTQGAIKKSFSMELACIIFRKLAKCKAFPSDKYIMNNFYAGCMDNLSFGSSENRTDKELLLLHLKQLIIILKNAGILDHLFSGSMASKTFMFNHVHIYLQMLNSFWNKTSWVSLFPSLPETAKGINKYRAILINLMRREKGRVRIDKISNTFFKTTGIGKTNDLLLISFLDFTIFTWMNFFGIIDYITGMDKDPVFFEITLHGRKMLEYLSQPV